MNYVNYEWWIVGSFGMIGECRQFECGSEWNIGDPGYLWFRVTWISTAGIKKHPTLTDVDPPRGLMVHKITSFGISIWS
jgi:hypothetical protein